MFWRQSVGSEGGRTLKPKRRFTSVMGLSKKSTRGLARVVRSACGIEGSRNSRRSPCAGTELPVSDGPPASQAHQFQPSWRGARVRFNRDNDPDVRKRININRDRWSVADRESGLFLERLLELLEDRGCFCNFRCTEMDWFTSSAVRMLSCGKFPWCARGYASRVRECTCSILKQPLRSRRLVVRWTGSESTCCVASATRTCGGCNGLTSITTTSPSRPFTINP